MCYAILIEADYYISNYHCLLNITAWKRCSQNYTLPLIQTT